MGGTEEKRDYADTIQQDILHIWCDEWWYFFRRMVFKLGPLGILPQGWEKPVALIFCSESIKTVSDLLLGLYFVERVWPCMHAKSLQSCPTVCDPMDCSLPDSSVDGILQARILEQVAIPSSRGPSCPRGQTHASYCLLRWHVGSLPPCLVAQACPVQVLKMMLLSNKN